MTAPTATLQGVKKCQARDRREACEEERQTDANMEQKQQDGWMLNPVLRQPLAMRVQAEEICLVQNSTLPTTEVLKGTVPSHAIAGTRPYYSTEYSPDFHKLGSTLSHGKCRTMSLSRENITIPLELSTKTTRVPYSEKRRFQDKQEEIEHVKQLDKWKPAVSIFSSVLGRLDDKTS